jgi:hypothetical protein
MERVVCSRGRVRFKAWVQLAAPTHHQDILSGWPAESEIGAPEALAAWNKFKAGPI